MTETAQDPEQAFPAGLGPAGQALWSSLQAQWSFDADEVAILTEAAATSDELQRLRIALWTAPSTVLGSEGQPRPNPIFAEVRNHRALLQRLLAQLRVPSKLHDPDAVIRPASAVSDAAREVASARWRKDRRGS